MPVSTKFQTMQFHPCVLPISTRFYNVITKQVQQGNGNNDSDLLTVNFRDTSYSAEAGGYHPVEIMIRNEGNKWRLCYITDFAYSGGVYPELTIELDFNIESNIFRQMFLAPCALAHREVKSFYRTWEGNFLEYLSDGVFDQIKVTKS
ncbi:DUF2787 domain-containing protein [Vibrio sp. G41H]|uniref:DUF2787 domain-containing protein n=1 Tax=Vibrio TaxID=662 RepID=UPI000D33E7A7|nr:MULTISPECIES: DUF2787 domain-containing protein [Vibrio]MBO7910473.1 DUF2787 domain-containing protein [Vibrio sp. G41H]MCF7489302.1 DUF2787 domain-containing protein [Vibrio sp. G-C-1]PTP61178.1 DUF2787 domain-containing protein [Vibrio splendidus]